MSQWVRILSYELLSIYLTETCQKDQQSVSLNPLYNVLVESIHPDGCRIKSKPQTQLVGYLPWDDLKESTEEKTSRFSQ